jgi:hypothetical protein
MEQDNPSFKVAVKTILQEEWDNLADLFDTAKAVENFAEGNVKVEDGEVYFKDEIVHGHVVGRILDLMSDEKPYKSVIRFLDKLMGNPSRRAVNELYAFLEHKSMPLTPEGNFLAYKGVREDFTDWYSGKFTNKVGDVNEMPRRGVCDDYNIGCSSGFHAGSLEYAKGYGNGGNLMVVEIDPSDVVSVPHDCDQQKLRTCKYKVVALFEKKLEESVVYPNDDGTIHYEDDEDDYDEDSDLDIAYNEGYKAALKKLSKEFGSGGSATNAR